MKRFNAFTLAEVLFHPEEQSKKIAFTLAEVLITLGIIGVVAALTIPTLITNYRKHIVTSRLQKYYSTMNQALQRYYADEGIVPSDLRFSDWNNNDYTLNWYKSTIGKYIQTLSTEKEEETKYIKVTFNDGSGFISYIENYYAMYIFYCVEAKYCKPNRMDGNNSFLFSLYNGKLYTSLPSMHYYSREELLESCKYGNYDNIEVSIPDKRHACARLIEYDGWQIKDDYPWKQTILEPKN